MSPKLVFFLSENEGASGKLSKIMYQFWNLTNKWLKSFQEKITMCIPREWHLSVGFTSACNSNGPAQSMIWDSQTAVLLKAYIAGCAVLIGEMVLNFSQLPQVKLFLCVIKHLKH